MDNVWVNPAQTFEQLREGTQVMCADGALHVDLVREIAQGHDSLIKYLLVEASTSGHHEMNFNTTARM